MDDARLFALLDAHAPWRPTSLVPTLSAWHADDELPLWQAIEAETTRIEPPFFAVAWPGAQGLARAIVDGVVDVNGKRVVDVGAGSGVASVAAARAGAAHVTALDVDALAVRASLELARRNGPTKGRAGVPARHAHGSDADNAHLPVAAAEGRLYRLTQPLIEARVADALRSPDEVRDAEVVLAGDLVYGEAIRDAFARALATWRSEQREVIIADSGRPFFDATGLTRLAAYDVETPRVLDGKTHRTVTIYRSGNG